MLPFYFFFQILLLIKIIKKENIKIVHAHWLIPNALITVLCKKILKSDFKIISTIHGSDFWGFTNKMGNSIKKYTLNNIDLLTVVSDAIKEKVIEFGYKKEIFVYPMGIDTNLFSPAKRDETLKDRFQIKGPFLLFVGIIVEQKGIRFLIQAMPNVIKKHSDAKLVIVGDGSLKNEMVELAKKLGISRNVIFTGSIAHNDLPPYFATADLFILPSFSEGFGLVIIEALSCKTITLCSDLPAIHDIIIDNETGFYFKEISPNIIGNKINNILSNKAKYKYIRENGRQHVIDQFDWNIVKENYLNLLYNL